MAPSVQRVCGCTSWVYCDRGISALALCHLDMPGGTDFTSLLQAETRSHYPEAVSFAFVP